MRKLVYLATVFLAIFLSSAVMAVRVTSIYQAEIPVTSESSQAKSQAATEGLSQVFIKVSGNSQVLESYPALKASLNQANTLAQEYHYSTSSKANKTLTIRYDSEGVDRILADNSVPVWGQNRPLILVWLAYDAPSHPTDIVDGTTSDIQQALKHAAAARGVPFILPVMDMDDITKVSVNDVTALSIPVLQQASTRYESNAILIGKMTASNTDVSSEWTLVMDDQQTHWTITGKDPAEVFEVVTNNVADLLAGHYSTVLTEKALAQVTLHIEGIKQNADLLRLMKYLQHISTVTDVQLMSVADNDVTLNVSLRGSEQAFIRALAISKNLAVVAQSKPGDDSLQYLWKP